MSRREFLAASAAGAAFASGAAGSDSGAPAAVPDALVALTSRDGVYTPPRGKGAMQFSFDFPEPSVRIGELLFAFRIQTFENVYAVDPGRTRVQRDGGATTLSSEGLTWAGGQEAAAGRLVATLKRDDHGIVAWQLRAEMQLPVKSITTIVRGIPRGELSVSCGKFFDPKDDELIYEYPQLFGGMSTPLVVVRAVDGSLFELSARQTAVRAARFFFQPGPDGYRVELIHEHEGWSRSASVDTCQWRVGPAANYAAVARTHFGHVERTYGVPRWETRADAPAWMRDIGLVLSIHGAHWSGYLFNTYSQMLDTLRWVAKRIEPRHVMVFLPAWDGRYYWNYPLYEPDPRMGGEAGFRRLIDTAQKLGFRMVPMFGANSANREWPQFKEFAAATTEHIDGDAFDLNWVDWDSDRRNEGWMPFMNLGVDSWRNWLVERISQVIARFGVDAYFLDIAGAWENNRKGDMHVGTRRLIAELRARHPGIPPIGEMLYDAQMADVPMSQVTRYAEYAAGSDAYIRNFEHLSRPAPGRGSTGVHEAGFRPYTADIATEQRAIPTLTIVDDTLGTYHEAMAAYIAAARNRLTRQPEK